MSSELEAAVAQRTNHPRKPGVVSTCFNDCPVVHEDHHVRSVHKLYAVCAEDSGLSPEELHDAFLHEVLSHVCINCCQRIIEEVDVFLLECLDHSGRRRKESRLVMKTCLVSFYAS